MVDYRDILTDSEKFVIIMQKFIGEYNTQENLAKEMEIPKQSISDWKNHSRRIQIKNRNKICRKFRLNDMVWIDKYSDTVNFEEQLDKYKLVSKVKTEEVSLASLGFNIIKKPIRQITENEKASLENLKSKKIVLLQKLSLEDKSAMFLFSLSKLLKSNNQIEESLEALNLIEKQDTEFRYSYRKEIKHLKAILLSHEKIQKWDEAIHILRVLYEETAYHLEEPEIITLLASNYKRKALISLDGKQKWIKKEDIDMNALSSALIIYRQAYELKNKNCYYDAINFAYLYNIAKHIEMDYAYDVELDNIYKLLSEDWKIDTSNWWEVSSNAEFLMLIGKVDLAIFYITEFLDEHSIEKFDIEATLRQLELYIHFTDENNAKEFYSFLKESWESLCLS